MNTTYRVLTIALIAMLPFGLVACGGGSDASADAGAKDSDHSEDEAAMDSGRVAIPASVRSNLGISFIKVERRRIEQTLRVPGRFEYLPTARREYRTVLPGRVELLVEQFERVDAGAPLYRIDSLAWRDIQQDLAEADSSITRLTAKLESLGPLWEAHVQLGQSLGESIEIWLERVGQLESMREAGGGRAEQIAQARSTLASTRAELARVQEIKAQFRAGKTQAEVELEASHVRLSFLLDSAAAIMTTSTENLEQSVETSHGTVPMWATINEIVVRATEPGIVESLGLTNGAWADERTAVLSVVQPDRLRFRASGLQSDLGVLRDGLLARIVPPAPTAVGNAVPIQSTMDGKLSIGLAGDPNDRTIELFVVPDTLRDWARPGVTAQLEIIIDSTASPQLAIPLAAIQRDGLVPVIFRRAPDDPNSAIRMEADLGKDDGRWVALLSGIRDGDEIVLDGAFQLMLATSGSIQKGGHFHADGTFHEGED